MEPLATMVIGLGTLVGTKVLEGIGAKIGENLFEAREQALIELKPNRPDLITAIEQAPNQPLNYSEAIAALQSAAQNNPNLRQKLEILAQLGQQEPKLDPYIQEAQKQWESQQSVVNQIRDNYGVVAQNIGKNVRIDNVQGDANF